MSVGGATSASLQGAANVHATATLPLATLHHMPGQTKLGDVPTLKPQNNAEYDAFDAGDFVSDWIANIGGELTPVFVDAMTRLAPGSENPIFAGKYGAVVRTRATIFVVNDMFSALAGPLANEVRRIVHAMLPNLAGPATPGLGLSLPPANEEVASLVKTVVTGVAKAWLTTAFAAPHPAPAAPAPAHAATNKPNIPGASPQSATDPHKQQPDSGTRVLGKDLGAMVHETLLFGVSAILSSFYDQTIGPVVQHLIDDAMGKPHKPVAKAKPMTPGGIAQSMVGSLLSSLFMRPVSWPTAGAEGAAAGGMFAVLASAFANGLISSMFDTVYQRGVGPAIEDSVNELAGIKPPPRQPQQPTGERLVRSIARSAVSGTAYYLADTLTMHFFTELGLDVGGPIGGLLAMAGASLVGITAGTATDALVGSAVGELAGDVYSWVTGEPATVPAIYDRRAQRSQPVAAHAAAN